MPSDMTISKVLGSREWQGQHGPMVTYKLELEQLEGVHELNQKPTTPPPVVGESIFANVEPPSKEGFPPRLKRVQQSGSFTSGPFRPRQDDPAQRRSIERQVAAKLASELICADKAELKDFRALTDRVHAAIEGAA